MRKIYSILIYSLLTAAGCLQLQTLAAASSPDYVCGMVLRPGVYGRNASPDQRGIPIFNCIGTEELVLRQWKAARTAPGASPKPEAVEAFALSRGADSTILAANTGQSGEAAGNKKPAQPPQHTQEIALGGEGAVENALEDVTTLGNNVVAKTPVKYHVSEEDYNILLRIVSAEAGAEDTMGQILVANVILNRVQHDYYPSTVKDVVFQNCNGSPQFSPTVDGRYNTVVVSDQTREAVNRALGGEDYSMGALFFSARSQADPDNMSWFDRNLKWLMKHGGHEFYTIPD